MNRKHPRTVLYALALVGFLLFISPVSIDSQVGAKRSPPPRKVRLETVQFQSKLVGKTLPYNVILPSDYGVSAIRYPVLYLLHGWAGHYSDWATRTNIADYAAQYGLILVMPEGNNGWYIDSATVATDKYESHILQELIPDVQHRYRTIESRYGRGIAGLSMGGYGALRFGLKHAEMFAFAGSLSGALAAATWTQNDLKGFASIYDSLRNSFGTEESETRKTNDIFGVVRRFTPAQVTAVPYVYFDCGTEDFFLGVNEQFAALLTEKKVAHEFRELPGAHGWQYWDQQVKELLKVAAEKLKAPRKNKL